MTAQASERRSSGGPGAKDLLANGADRALLPHAKRLQADLQGYALERAPGRRIQRAHSGIGRLRGRCQRSSRGDAQQVPA